MPTQRDAEQSEKFKDIFQHICDRCREEAEEANGKKFDFDKDEMDPVSEALAVFFERMADIIEEAIEQVD
jgi:DNA-binding cell septation regulator SpoVG